LRYIIDIPGKPVSKQRPRMGKGGRVYTPKATRAYEQRVSVLCKEQADRPIEGPCRVEIDVWYTDRRRRDLDNAIKSLWDGANGILYNDDSQIIEVTARKHLAAEEAGARIVVEAIEEDV